MYLNEIKLIGFVGQQVERKQTSTGKDLVRFDVATRASWKKKDDDGYEQRTEWHHIVVFGGLTKFARTIQKGDHIYLSGELRYREYEKQVGKREDKETVDIARTEIYASEIRRLTPQGD